MGNDNHRNATRRCRNLNKNVDTTKTITHVSLCAGYGGIDLGLQRAIPSLRTILFSEIEAFAVANLVSKMEAGLLDAAPVWTNLKTFPWGKFRGVVDILSGGYPCQPFSAAGKRLGTEDPRHLWPYIADGIAAMRPSVCFFENVEGHISLGLPDVIEDLGRMGYRTTWGIFSASEVGAPHQRKRVFIMAHRKCERLERWGCGLQPESNRRGAPNNTWESRNLLVNTIDNDGGNVPRDQRREEEQPISGDSSLMAHTMCNGGREGREIRQGADGAIPISKGEPRGAWPSRPGQPQYAWEPPRVVGDSERIRLEPTGDEGAMGEESSNPTRERGELAPTFKESSYPSASVGNSASLRPCGGGEDGSGEQSEVFRAGSEYSKDQRKTQPSLGGDPNGASCGMGYAELQEPDNADCGTIGWESGASSMAHSQHAGCDHSKEGSFQHGDQGALGKETTQQTRRDRIHSSEHRETIRNDQLYPDLYTSCDNRTDELRLLGNGVVPATAELAFRTLWRELTK